jgi:hypothetical protein
MEEAAQMHHHYLDNQSSKQYKKPIPNLHGLLMKFLSPKTTVGLQI